MDGSSSHKRKHKEIHDDDDDLGANKPNPLPVIGIDKLSDDLIIAILSGLNLEEAVRTSVLSRRWKYLWVYAFTHLKFDDKSRKSKYSVNNLLKSYSHVVNPPLRSLKLAGVDIEDDVVHRFLASCPRLEELCISDSCATRNLLVVDPPNLKALEVKKCPRLQTLEISSVSLVSLTYEGLRDVLLLKEIPNLRELSLGDDICVSFIFESHRHSSYSVQLVKLRLDFCLLNRRDYIARLDLPPLCSLERLELVSPSIISRNLLFVSSFIKASPQLRELRSEMSYALPEIHMLIQLLFLSPKDVKYDHKNLELVEVVGYCTTSTEEEFLVHLFEVASSLKRVVIQSMFGHRLLVPSFPNHIELILK